MSGTQIGSDAESFYVPVCVWGVKNANPIY